jgi:hypothetical protein
MDSNLNSNRAISPNPHILEVIEWLGNHNYPALPVAPAQDPRECHKVVKTKNLNHKTGDYCPLDDNLQPIPLYTGKNPSYLDSKGKPHLINHRQYQKRLPNEQELKVWFANPNNGIGTLGGWNNTIWLDFDTKHFDSDLAYEAALVAILENHPQLRQTWLERTQSNGWRIGVRVLKTPDFTNFALAPAGKHIGEALGAGRFTVLAPTIGPSGNPYRSINRALPVEVESLLAIGIYPSSSPKKPPELSEQLNQIREAIPSSIGLDMLCSDFSCTVLRGEDPCRDRSASLATALADWYGWENYCHKYGINYSGNAESLAHQAGVLLGLDADRINRIVKTVDKASCTPAAERKGGDVSCWKKIRRLAPTTYKALCPSHIKEKLTSANQQHQESSNHLEQPNEWFAPESHNGEIGLWKTETVIKMQVNAVTGETIPEVDTKGNQIKEKLRKFVPLCDFDFTIERELAGEPGGYVLQVKRSTDGWQKRVVISSSDCKRAVDFEIAIEKGLGVDVSCNLRTDQLKALLRERRLAYRYREGKTYQLAERVGKQDNGIWVFKDCQFKSDGSPTTEDETGICWNPNLGASEKGADEIKSPKIAPPNPEALPQLVSAMRQFFGSNFLPAFFVLGYCAAAAHFQTIIKAEGRFPILNTYGPPGGGKTIAVECGLSLFGHEWISGAIVGDISPSALWEQGKLCGSLPICLDDPPDKIYDELEQWIRNWYNATARKRRWNVQQPHCALIINANKACGEKLPATLSRLIRLWIPIAKNTNPLAWNQLKKAQKQASGAFTSIIKLGYPQQEINELTAELIQHLPLAHDRVAPSLALIGVYTMKLATLAGLNPEEHKRYLIDVLCQNANDEESSQDALTHFLGVMMTAQAENLLGGWNLRRCNDELGRCRSIAIEIGVFDLLKENFDLPYSKKVIKTLIEQAGGKTRSTQWFDENKDLSQTYARGLLFPKSNQNDKSTSPTPPPKKKRRCWEIPAFLAAEYIQLDDPPSDESTEFNGTNGTIENHLEPKSGSSLKADQNGGLASETSLEPLKPETNHLQTEQVNQTSLVPVVDNSPKTGGVFSSEMVPAETPATSGFDLEPKNGSKDAELNNDLQTYLEAITLVQTVEELKLFLECIANLSQQQQDAIWQAAPVEVLNLLQELRISQGEANHSQTPDH